MFESIRTLVLRWMRVPHDPEPPAGAPESIRVFRAAENYYKFRLLGWVLTQLVGVAAIVFWIWMLGMFARKVDAAHDAVLSSAASAAVTPVLPAPSGRLAGPPTSPQIGSGGGAKTPAQRNAPSRRRTAQLARIPVGVIWVLRALEIFGIAGFIAQLPFTLAALRLDYEMRWYIVTDRSLRIRSGIWRVQEMTMSFANIQQVAITRDPIQGLLKICDLRVQSAGGGGGNAREGRRDTLHTGVFQGVANAAEIRDLILERLKRFRAAGLGDPDDATHATTPDLPGSPALLAARELLHEAKALRVALG